MERVIGQGFVGACILSLVMVAVASGQEVKVRLRDGSARGFLVLRSETGGSDKGSTRVPFQRRLTQRRNYRLLTKVNFSSDQRSAGTEGANFSGTLRNDD